MSSLNNAGSLFAPNESKSDQFGQWLTFFMELDGLNDEDDPGARWI